MNSEERRMDDGCCDMRGMLGFLILVFSIKKTNAWKRTC